MRRKKQERTNQKEMNKNLRTRKYEFKESTRKNPSDTIIKEETQQKTNEKKLTRTRINLRKIYKREKTNEKYIYQKKMH